MSCAGVWNRAAVAEVDVARMLASFAHSAWSVRVQLDAESRVAVAEASYGDDTEASPHGEPPLEAALLVGGDLRLHNRAELSAALGLDDSGRSDRFLIAAAYRRWGTEFPRQVLGDFGLALWDASQRRLMLVRDTGGACPMFYSTHGGRLAFASHPRGLLALAGFPRALGERAVVDYLGELPQEEEATLFAAIRRVPPGHTLVVEETSDRLVSYFDVNEIAEQRLAGDDDYARALRDTLALAVDCRLPSSRRLAVMLSGGLDSSSIALLAGRTGSERKPDLLTVSAIFPDMPECDERSFQSAVVAAIGSRHCEVQPDPDQAAGDFARLCRVFSEPSFIGPHWLAWAASEAATAGGATSMMTGIDGDRVVSHGAGRFGDLAAAGDFRGLARELRDVHDFDWQRRVRVGATQALFALLPERWERAFDALDPRHPAQVALRTAGLRADLLVRHDVASRLRIQPRRARSTRVEHARSLVAPDRNWDVELLEQLGTAFNLRFEQPFFDRRVVELCFSFPGSQKRNHGWPRYVLRNAFRDRLPPTVVNRRTDASFDRPYWQWARRWLLSHGANCDTLSNIAEYIDVSRVRAVLRDLPSEPSGGPVDFLWKCVVLSRWLDATATR